MEKAYEKINIVFEDNHILVVVKPQNIPVQEDESHDADLLNMLKEYLVDKYEKPGEAYLGLVHRLDRPTGGVMVFAKTSKAAARLAESMKSGEFEKRYFAITSGIPQDKAKRLVHYLKKNETINKTLIVPLTTEGAKKAITDYELLAENDGLALLSVNILTGRGHQIRVQLAANGTPIMGDVKYGDDRAQNSHTNLMLWAYELKIVHPTTKEKLVFRVSPDQQEALWNKFDIDRFLDVRQPY